MKLVLTTKFCHGKAYPNTFLIIGNPFYCDSHFLAYATSSFSHLQELLNLTRSTPERRPWSHLINFAGTAFPLRTNDEMAMILDNLRNDTFDYGGHNRADHAYGNVPYCGMKYREFVK